MTDQEHYLPDGLVDLEPGDILCWDLQPEPGEYYLVATSKFDAIVSELLGAKKALADAVELGFSSIDAMQAIWDSDSEVQACGAGATAMPELYNYLNHQRFDHVDGQQPSDQPVKESPQEEAS
ncbi:hypothetical protein CCB80_03120 [Armatimonadetes bacterium Uphvl-Ar1]|nr:hypothetical protein CCB80_03120 [Armatimonadetes bacterium Uphvl-Ar1]